MKLLSYLQKAIWGVSLIGYWTDYRSHTQSDVSSLLNLYTPPQNLLSTSSLVNVAHQIPIWVAPSRSPTHPTPPVSGGRLRLGRLPGPVPTWQTSPPLKTFYPSTSTFGTHPPPHQVAEGLHSIALQWLEATAAEPINGSNPANAKWLHLLCCIPLDNSVIISWKFWVKCKWLQ